MLLVTTSDSYTLAESYEMCEANWCLNCTVLYICNYTVIVHNNDYIKKYFCSGCCNCSGVIQIIVSIMKQAVASRQQRVTEHYTRKTLVYFRLVQKHRWKQYKLMWTAVYIANIWTH